MTDCNECGMRDDDWFLCRTTDCPQRIVDAQDATIASLRDANKALTAEAEYDRSQIQRLQAALFYWMPGVSEEIEVELNGRAGDDAYLLAGFEGDISGECWGNTILADRDRLSAELAEARALLERWIGWCGEYKKGMPHPADDLAAARSFLASKEASHAD